MVECIQQVLKRDAVDVLHHDSVLVIQVLEDAHDAAMLHLLEERKLLSEQGHGILISVFSERLKTLREDADEDAMALLTQEFALLEQVKHRGIVRVFEYLYDENAVVMEYIHGVSLQDLLDALNHKNEQICSFLWLSASNRS